RKMPRVQPSSPVKRSTRCCAMRIPVPMQVRSSLASVDKAIKSAASMKIYRDWFRMGAQRTGVVGQCGQLRHDVDVGETYGGCVDRMHAWGKSAPPRTLACMKRDVIGNSPRLKCLEQIRSCALCLCLCEGG